MNEELKILKRKVDIIEEDERKRKENIYFWKKMIGFSLLIMGSGLIGASFIMAYYPSIYNFMAYELSGLIMFSVGYILYCLKFD